MRKSEEWQKAKKVSKINKRESGGTACQLAGRQALVVRFGISGGNTQ